MFQSDSTSTRVVLLFLLDFSRLVSNFKSRLIRLEVRLATIPFFHMHTSHLTPHSRSQEARDPKKAARRTRATMDDTEGDGAGGASAPAPAESRASPWPSGSAAPARVEEPAVAPAPFPWALEAVAASSTTILSDASGLLALQHILGLGVLGAHAVLCRDPGPCCDH